MHLSNVPCSAHLIEERVVSHLDPCVVLLTSNDHFHHRIDVVAHELSGFIHLHSNLQEDHSRGLTLGSLSPIGILLS